MAILATISVGVLGAVRAPSPAAPLLALLRGVVQLAALSVILSGVITSPLWVGIALVVMFAVAVGVATNRLGRSFGTLGIVALGIGSGVAVAMLVVFATGALEFSARYALALGGILIGNAMTITTLAGRRFLEAAHERWDEVESWLALGARPRQATALLASSSIRTALIPTIDQTKTTGLVTLPGAFVGAIFGGVSPLEAGRFQVIVLAGILAAGAITAAIVIGALAPVRTKPAGPA